MNQDLNTHDQLPQWRQSQYGSEFCPFSDLPEDVRSQLRQEDKYNATIDGFKYTVKDYDGKWLVFRREVATNTTGTGQVLHHVNHVNNLREIKIMPLKEA